VGWDLPLNAAEKFRSVIEAQAVLNDEARAAQRHRSRQYANLISADKDVLSANIALFRDLAAR
jgi:hypothetical protein